MKGRRSRAKKILDSLPKEEETNTMYIVSYDFHKQKPHHGFWSNLNEIIINTNGERIHYSVYYGDKRGAKAVQELATDYGADVRCFAAIEIR